jgi:hypothetical protein
MGQGWNSRVFIGFKPQCPTVGTKRRRGIYDYLDGSTARYYSQPARSSPARISAMAVALLFQGAGPHRPAAITGVVGGRWRMAAAGGSRRALIASDPRPRSLRAELRVWEQRGAFPNEYVIACRRPWTSVSAASDVGGKRGERRRIRLRIGPWWLELVHEAWSSLMHVAALAR